MPRSKAAVCKASQNVRSRSFLLHVSMEAVAKGTIQAHSGVYCPIKSGDKIVILGKHGDWYHCRNKYGMTGKIPTSYAKPLNSVSIDKSSPEQPSFSPSSSPKTKYKSSFIGYEHKMESDSEETFDEIEGNLQNDKKQIITMMGGDFLQFKNPNIHIPSINDKNMDLHSLKLSKTQPIMSTNDIVIDESASDSEGDCLIQPGVTLMGDIDEKNTEKLVFKCEDEDNNMNENHDKKPDIITKGVTLMGSIGHDKLSFIK